MNSLLFRRSRFCYNFRAIKKAAPSKTILPFLFAKARRQVCPYDFISALFIHFVCSLYSQYIIFKKHITVYQVKIPIIPYCFFSRISIRDFGQNPVFICFLNDFSQFIRGSIFNNALSLSAGNIRIMLPSAPFHSSNG